MKIKKFISIVFLSIFMILPTSAMAASYAYNFEFRNYLQSNLYDLYPSIITNYKITMTNNSSASGTGTSAIYYVDLYRANSLGVGVYMGVQQFDRNGTVTKSWIISDKKGGRWGFTMRKNDDGQYVKGFGQIKD
ncbi:hypothetical protein K7887_21890 (plasmid) [Sutcliffiella horikoshii]|uniref:hypothetical protein n=1 Tax=Sutcliffiella horikoshii TaxID=79883 RepID=UPI001CC02574|nr:hypothetical protein [Sutcliffiella horikoshii]UAL49718.1 hypothetical protein K7887_21890 [Sutcliffiella horikoshii]